MVSVCRAAAAAVSLVVVKGGAGDGTCTLLIVVCMAIFFLEQCTSNGEWHEHRQVELELLVVLVKLNDASCGAPIGTARADSPTAGATTLRATVALLQSRAGLNRSPARAGPNPR